eukprot:1138848-Pelagomonas_calceolata.AAC.9
MSTCEKHLSNVAAPGRSQHSQAADAVRAPPSRTTPDTPPPAAPVQSSYMFQHCCTSSQSHWSASNLSTHLLPQHKRFPVDVHHRLLAHVHPQRMHAPTCPWTAGAAHAAQHSAHTLHGGHAHTIDGHARDTPMRGTQAWSERCAR